MDIVTYPMNWKVSRSHEDFELLRGILVKKYPHILVPALPRYSVRKKLSEKHLVSRRD